MGREEEGEEEVDGGVKGEGAVDQRSVEKDGTQRICPECTTATTPDDSKLIISLLSLQ